MRRVIIATLGMILFAAILVGPGQAQVERQEWEPCGLTTRDATIKVGADGTLECDVGQPIEIRNELADPRDGREATRELLTAFFAIADVQLADEESPARGEGADPCYPSPGVSSSAFRPHETMVPHLMNAHIRAANAIAATGTPNVPGGSFDFLMGLGDLADNQQYNEIRWIIDILDGEQFVDPDTGDEGYDGPQADEPTGGNGRTTEEVAPELPGSVLELANEPFWATGFRLGNDLAAQRLPWYSLPGNHDVKVQGTLPDELTGHHHDDMKLWRAVYRAYYTGHTKVVFQDLPPERKQKLCKAFEEEDQALFMEAMTEILSDPVGSAGNKIVPADPARMPLYRSQQMKQTGDQDACLAVANVNAEAQHACRSSWIDEHRVTTGFPVGHGYGAGDGDGTRCTDADGKILERACYSFGDGQFHYIGVDSNPPEGAEAGNIDPKQFAWLERELIAHSTTYYDASGNEVSNPTGKDRFIVVLAHHPTVSMRNQAPSSPGKTGQALIDLLTRFPNVILNANGHTHQNQIWPREGQVGPGYWEVNTSAIADYPTQSRTFEIVDNKDGTLSIFATIFDAAVSPDAAKVDWAEHDPTSETALAHSHSHPHPHGAEAKDVNEDWLASWGREVVFHDPQHQKDVKEGQRADDLNVELLLPAPQWLGEGSTGTPDRTRSSESPAGTSESPAGTGESPTSGSSPTGTATTSAEPPSSPGSEEEAARSSFSTTIAARRSTVRLGKPIRLSGVAGSERCGVPNSVTVSKRVHGRATSHGMRSVSVAPDGSWATKLRARRNLSFLARPESTEACDGLTSNPIDVLVKSKITVRSVNCRTTRRVTGRVRPSNRGAKVSLARRKRGSWKVIDTDRLDRRGRFALNLNRCRGTYRVRGPLNSAQNSPGHDRFRI
jgi:3',5'-cyclic AMP phosphodiesterase CpdA